MKLKLPLDSVPEWIWRVVREGGNVAAFCRERDNLGWSTGDEVN